MTEPNYDTHKLVSAKDVRPGDLVCFCVQSANYRVDEVDTDPLGRVRHHHGDHTASSSYDPGEPLWVLREGNQVKDEGTVIEYVDITPTWGEWALVYRRLAESGEVKAIRHLREDFAQMAASSQALQRLMLDSTLTVEQHALIDSVMTEELRKQGF